MKNDHDEEIRLHHQKWKRWKQDIKNQTVKKQSKPQEKPQQSAHSFATKIINKLQQNQSKKTNEVAEHFKKQFENNSCTVCFQLMIPPRHPMTLFPCGHNICKICLLNGQGKAKSLKIQSCPLCCEKISNYAVNINLMNLICSYTNNQHLIQKQQKVEEPQIIQPQTQTQTADRLRLRCQILQKQKKAIATMLAKQKKQKQVLQQVMGKLKIEKTKNSQDLQSLRKQLKLIDDFLTSKNQQLQKIKSKITNVQQKKRVIDKTLEPLKIQKQKLQVLQAARMMKR